MNVFLVVTIALVGMPDHGLDVTPEDLQPVVLEQASLEPMTLSECRTKGKRIMAYLDTGSMVSVEFDCIPADVEIPTSF